MINLYQNYFGDLLSGFLDAKLYETGANTTKITIKGAKYTENLTRCGTGAANIINKIRKNNKILLLFRHFFKINFVTFVIFFTRYFCGSPVISKNFR